MPNPLPQPGPISYNGIIFGVYTKTTRYQVKPLPDAAKRGVTAVEYTISLKGPVFYGSSDIGTTVGEKLTTIIQKLSQPAGAFTYGVGTGMRPLVVNQGIVRDVAYGPWPEILSIEPAGGGDQGAADVEWTVRVTIPECDCGVPTYQGQIMELVFTLGFDLDKSGYTKRTYDGYLRIPTTRANECSQILQDQADAYRDKIVPPLLSGFRRTSQTYKLDESKTKLSWTIVDDEMPPTCPPPDCIEVEAEHTVSTSMPGVNGLQWAGTISATYEMARTADPSTAYDYFAAFVQDRLSQARANNVQGVNGAGAVTMITSQELSQAEIYGRRQARFSVRYQFASDLNKILLASGLWRPVPNSDWTAWATSMLNDGVLTTRGNAQLAFDKTQDVIVSLCKQSQGQLASTDSLGAGAQPQSSSFLQNRLPDPSQSWIHYDLRVLVEADDRILEHKPLSQDVPVVLNGGNNGGQFGLNTGDGTIPNSNPGGGNMVNNQQPFQFNYPQGLTSSVLQRPGVPSVYVTLLGEGLRAGYLIDLPVVTQIGGVPAVAASRPGIEYFRQSALANWGGIPIAGAVWRQRYLLPTLPNTGIGVPPNWLLGVPS